MRTKNTLVFTLNTVETLVTSCLCFCYKVGKPQLRDGFPQISCSLVVLFGIAQVDPDSQSELIHLSLSKQGFWLTLVYTLLIPHLSLVYVLGNAMSVEEAMRLQAVLLGLGDLDLRRCHGRVI